VLRCEECGCVTEGARGWIAQLIMDDEEEPDVEPCVVAYCDGESRLQTRGQAAALAVSSQETRTLHRRQRPPL
jgi:hypothetical protein